MAIKDVVSGFRDFIARGNVIDLAVAVVIGAAFTGVVQAFVKDILTPLIAAIFGKQDFSSLTFTINGSEFRYGDLVNAVINFVLVAAAIYFFVVVPMNHLLSRLKRNTEPESEAPAPDVLLLTEIRDLLRAQGGAAGTTAGTPIDPGTL